MTRKTLAPWSTHPPLPGQPASFAHNTFAVRVPKLIDDVIAKSPDLGAAQVTALRALRTEITDGTLRLLQDDGPDNAWWGRACAPYVGKTWLALPWFFAETYFYRRTLEATGYFAQGATHLRDPFLAHKHEDERGVLQKVAPLRATAFANDVDCVVAHLKASLWGNRVDLSYTAGLRFGDAGGDDDLLVDDSRVVAERLLASKNVAIILDNAGTELSYDLLLADQLRRRGIAVTLMPKAQPFFISDVIPVDVERTEDLLGLARFSVRTHAYFTTSGFYFQDEMPADLVADLRTFDLVLLKGDANYRRSLGDAPWDPTVALADVADFPAPCAWLRTCKAETAAGLRKDVVARAAARDAEWMTSGRFGLVQRFF